VGPDRLDPGARDEGRAGSVAARDARPLTGFGIIPSVGDTEIAQYHQQFEAISAGAKELTEGLNEARFNWRRSPEEWSIEECLSHLISVGTWEVRAIEKAVDDGLARGIKTTGPFHYGTIERYVIGLTEPPARVKVSAPRRFVPLHGQPVTAILPTFLHLQRQLEIQLDRASGLDLARVKVPTPIVPLMKLGLGATFAQIAAHERRHLAQARRVRERLGAGALVSH
jgi:hypothetical protein